MIDAAEAEQRFSLAGQVGFPYFGGKRRQEIRLYEDGWHVPGDLVSDFDYEGLPYHIIVDGDLTVGGDLGWTTFEHAAFLLVVGDLRARVVVLDGMPSAPELVVGGDLVVEYGVLGDMSGPRGGRLIVGGATRTPVVVAIEDFTMDFRRAPEALVIGDAGNFTGPFEVAAFHDVLHPQLLDGDEPYRTRIRDGLTEGTSILR
ncbi:hypothetical protein Lfu02_77430 [Longispora fulva]|nr:hypothetical protein Lfu02_77430 [Longispora fulva]